MSIHDVIEEVFAGERQILELSMLVQHQGPPGQLQPPFFTHRQSRENVGGGLESLGRPVSLL